MALLTKNKKKQEVEKSATLQGAERLAQLRREGDKDAIAAHVTRHADERGSAAYERASKNF